MEEENKINIEIKRKNDKKSELEGQKLNLEKQVTLLLKETSQWKKYLT